MSCVIHKAHSIDIILMSLYPPRLPACLPIIQVQVPIISSSQQLPAITAERHAEDTKLLVIWREGQRLMVVLMIQDGDLVQAV